MDKKQVYKILKSRSDQLTKLSRIEAIMRIDHKGGDIQRGTRQNDSIQINILHCLPHKIEQWLVAIFKNCT